jgi:hypothetical protein
MLPAGDLMNTQIVRNHLQLTAERLEEELGEKRNITRLEDSEKEEER